MSGFAFVGPAASPILPEEAGLIPILTDQNRWAQSRMPRDMMVQG